MRAIKIKEEYLPERCEVCHQADLFDAQNNYCARCATLTPEKITTLNTETPNIYFTIIDWLQSALFIGIWIMITSPLITSYIDKSGAMFTDALEMAPIAAIVTTMIAIIWRFKLHYKLIPVLMMSISSLLLVLKPIIAPVRYAYGGGVFSLTSETHLYFLIPGILMMIVSIILIADLLINHREFKMK